MKLLIEVPGIPIAQPRQRHRIANSNGKQFVMNYTPTKAPVNAFKAAVQLAARMKYQGPLLNPPITLYCKFIMPRPKAMYWKTREMPRVPHCQRPDCDNLAKAVMDALSGVLWRDDVMVCRLGVEKWIADGEEAPHTSILITREFSELCLDAEDAIDDEECNYSRT